MFKMLMTAELTEQQYYAITRKMKKIKLREIAEVLGCSVPLLSMWETGRTEMNSYFIKIYKQIIDNK